MGASYTLVIGTPRYSTWSLRPWLILKSLGVDFETVRITLRQPDTKANIQEWSPSAKVPLLIHRDPRWGERKIWDSLAIAEYLAEQFPGRGLWPEDAGARALARSISAEMHSGFQALRSQCSMDVLAHTPMTDIPEDLAADIERIETIWEDTRARHGQSGPFLFGRFTIADAMFAPVTTRFDTYGLGTHPTSKTYCDTILGTPWMKEWIEIAKDEVPGQPTAPARPGGV